MDCKFKQNLKDELGYQDMTVKQLSQETGIPVRTLENYLGKRDSVPPVDNAYLIAKALGVSLEWLVSGESGTQEHGIKSELRPMLRDVSALPQSVQDAFKTIARYSAGV